VLNTYPQNLSEEVVEDMAGGHDPKNKSCGWIPTTFNYLIIALEQPKPFLAKIKSQ